MRISDWSSDVCSSDLLEVEEAPVVLHQGGRSYIFAFEHEAKFLRVLQRVVEEVIVCARGSGGTNEVVQSFARRIDVVFESVLFVIGERRQSRHRAIQLSQLPVHIIEAAAETRRSEEHTSELQSLMRISYAVFCL